MPGQLVGVSRNQVGRVYFLDTTRPTTVGRLPGSDIVLETEPSVSARHALIYWSSPHFCVEDQGSANGTLVNGEPAVGATPLRHEDTLRLGEVEFRFLVDVRPHPLYPEPAAASRPTGFTPPTYGLPAAYTGYARKERIPAGLLAILLGILGVHHFYLNRNGRGIVTLLATFMAPLTCGMSVMVTFALGIIQGVMFLMSTDAEFEQKYLQEGRFF